MSDMTALIPFIPAIPIAGFAFTALFGRRIGRFAFLVPLLGGSC